MKANAPPHLKPIFDGEQKALKISANSVYGYFGALHSHYRCLSLAQAVTEFARSMLHQTIDWIQETISCTVLYGDTDSVMVTFDDEEDDACDGSVRDKEESSILERVSKAFDKGNMVSEVLSKRFNDFYNTDRILLEMEKVYLPWNILQKKRYFGLMYETPNSSPKPDCKGIELVRLDYCEVAQNVMMKVRDALLYNMEDARTKCVDVIREQLERLVDDEYDFSSYITSKSRARSEYKNEDIAHLRVVKTMREREAGSEPQVGDRVPFVIVERLDRSIKKVSDKAEAPDYAQKTGQKIDRLYYLEHQIINSVGGMIAAIDNIPEDLFSTFSTRLRQQQEKRLLTAEGQSMLSFVPISRDKRSVEEGSQPSQPSASSFESPPQSSFQNYSKKQKKQQQKQQKEASSKKQTTLGTHFVKL